MKIECFFRTSLRRLVRPGDGEGGGVVERVYLVCVIVADGSIDDAVLEHLRLGGRDLAGGDDLHFDGIVFRAQLSLGHGDGHLDQQVVRDALQVRLREAHHQP